MVSVKDLMNRTKAAALARETEKAASVGNSMPDLSDMPVTIQGQDAFEAQMAAARAESEARVAAEEEAKRAAKAEAEHLEELNRLEIEDMLSEGGPVHYEPGTALALIDESTEVDIYDEEDYDYRDFSPTDDDSFYDDIMAGVHIKPDPSQSSAVRRLCKVQYGCLIGAAGTGKTTTTRLLLHTLINGDAEYDIPPMRLSKVNLRAYLSSTNEAGEDGEAAAEVIPSIAFCAFTGQATQVIKRNMPGNWQKNVFTIHGLLAFYPEMYFDELEKKEKMRFVPYYTKLNKMPWDVIFIDEASMVSVDLWHMLLDAAKPGCRFYAIGDLNQLPPPIGMGMLGFALAKWTVAELTHVHRQSDDSANRIVDTAHLVLKGQKIEFDNPQTDPNWRVIGLELKHDTKEAYQQIVGICKGLSMKTTPEGEQLYDPWRDRVMTCMNGYDDNSTASLVGQYPINDALSQIFADPNEPRQIINHKTGSKAFAVGYRVMATKNESPAELNRVTNGLTGKIVAIEPNYKWVGDRRLVGDEKEVAHNRRVMLAEAMGKKHDSAADTAQKAAEAFGSLSFDGISAKDGTVTERNGGPASHIVTVKFDNGGTREYSMNAQIEQLMIAYASTTHKAQGAEMPTAIIVVHHAHRTMLCRENLYTAVTRARQRVIILYSSFGLQIALGKQKITGRTMEEKVKAYQKMLGEGEGSNAMGFKLVNVRLSEHDR